MATKAELYESLKNFDQEFGTSWAKGKSKAKKAELESALEEAHASQAPAQEVMNPVGTGKTSSIIDPIWQEISSMHTHNRKDRRRKAALLRKHRKLSPQYQG